MGKGNALFGVEKLKKTPTPDLTNTKKEGFSNANKKNDKTYKIHSKS